MLHIDDRNIDEFMYELTGETHRSKLWVLKIKLKRYLRNIKVVKDGECMKFLHHDLQALRFGKGYKKEITYLRYINPKGELVKQRFIVIPIPDGFNIHPARFSYPISDKGPKGPLTVKPGYHTKTKYELFGLRRRKVYTVDWKYSL